MTTINPYSYATDEFFMFEALRQAKIALNLDEVPIGAVVVFRKEIIGSGFNQTIRNKDASAHAEMIAIREACKNLDNYRLVDCELFVSIEPCVMCAGTLINARIKRLIYGSRQDKTGAIVSKLKVLEENLFNHNIQITENVLQQECLEILQGFFRKKRENAKHNKHSNNNKMLLY